MTAIHRRVELARTGTAPNTVARMASGWAIMADKQVTRGYCLLLPDPVVPTLNDLVGEARTQYLADMAALGDAILSVTGAARMNYEILGNQDPALHAHVVPRYLNDPADVRTKPIFFFDWEAAPDFDPAVYGELREAIAAALKAHE